MTRSDKKGEQKSWSRPGLKWEKENSCKYPELPKEGKYKPKGEQTWTGGRLESRIPKGRSGAPPNQLADTDRCGATSPHPTRPSAPGPDKSPTPPPSITLGSPAGCQTHLLSPHLPFPTLIFTTYTCPVRTPTQVNQHCLALTFLLVFCLERRLRYNKVEH